MENLFVRLLLGSLLIIGFFSKRSGKVYSICTIVIFILSAYFVNKGTHNPTGKDNSTEKLLSQLQLDSIGSEKDNRIISHREKLTITAKDLTESYDTNEGQADEKFKGKTFFVEGTVSEIKKDILNDTYVILEGNQMFRDVQCYFDDKKISPQLKKGKTVTFEGKCNGLMMNVHMKNCQLVENLSELKKQSKLKMYNAILICCGQI